MAIMRMGYAHVRVTDMAEAKQHYIETLGLKVTEEGDGKLYLKGWDEWDHHSVVLEEGGVGAVKFGYKVEKPEDIDVIEKRAQQFGDCTVERMSKGESQEVSDGIRIVSPSQHTWEIYHDMTQVGGETGYLNPEAFPRHEVGVSCPNLDHALVAAEDPTLLEKFFMEVMGMYPTEQVKPDADSKDIIASWLSAGQKVHDIALIPGPNGALHHFAFELGSWENILRAADLFAQDGVSIDIGPTRHGITRGTTIYFFDPSGNRNEVFAGGYRAYPDRPCITWTADQLGKGIFYHNRELNEAFTSVLT